ncbi:unnamed protein product [Brachionus calyciflorus]|uniref:Ubiquitin-like protein ATG12 n=1 Tax=Brachionus calyciflorus TaxID=104777 RepID=A0A813VRT5_9BILA|nr:unnamed protein product [Brachionus calyciflorus]
MSDSENSTNPNPQDELSNLDPVATPKFEEKPNTEEEDKLVTNPSSESQGIAANTTCQNPNKIEILLKAAGNAPILKKKKFLLERTKNVNFIIEWLKKYMKLDPKEQLFLYVNQEFAPSPDAEIGTIYDCFKIGNTVIFHYCTTPAWG